MNLCSSIRVINNTAASVFSVVATSCEFQKLSTFESLRRTKPNKDSVPTSILAILNALALFSLSFAVAPRARSVLARIAM